MIATFCLLYGLWSAFVAMQSGLVDNESLMAAGYSEGFVEHATWDHALHGLIYGIFLPSSIALLVLYPARSFYTLSVGALLYFGTYIMYNLLLLSPHRYPWLAVVVLFTVCVILVSSITYRRRQFALHESRTILKRESLRYTMEWMQLCQAEGFADGLGEIKSGWEYAQGKAGDMPNIMPKRQQKDGRFLGYGGIFLCMRT